MARVSDFLTLCLLLLFVETRLCEHFTRERGTKTSISCAFEKFEQNTTWQVRAGHDFINVTSCTFGNNICVDHMPQQYHGEVVTSEDGFTSRLIITNVRFNETEFICLTRYGYTTNTLEVYARPSKPLCDPVELDYTKKYLQFRCGATNVFPSVNAKLSITGTKLSQEDFHGGQCSTEKSGHLTVDGYSAECVWRVSAAKLEPVKYKYYVNMFPNLPNSTGINVPSAVSQDYTLQLSSPEAAIDFTRCPVGPGVVGDKIINGTTASCKCVLEWPGFPVGQARWYTEQGVQSLGRDDPTDGSSTLIIYSNTTGTWTSSPSLAHLTALCACREEVEIFETVPIEIVFGIGMKSQSFQCRAESLINNSQNSGPVYTPVFTILLSDPVCDPVELDYTKKDLQFTCRAINDYPSIKAILYIKGVNWLQIGVFSTNCSNEKPGSLTLGGHSTECVWSISAAKLEPLKYTYYVKMFPNLPNSTGVNISYVISQNNTLQLSSPVAVIGIKSCPIGYGVVHGKILTGSTASCKCVLESPGFPTGQARWYTLHGNESLGIDNIADGSSTLEIYNSTPGQSYRCRAESPLKNSLNWGPVYTPVFTTHDPETYSLRIEIVAGILAGIIVFTAVIAVVIWKWRCRKRQNADTTRVVYNRPSVDTHSDYGKPECSGNYNTLLF